MASPRPVPPTRPVANGSNRRSWRSAGMPGPLSLRVSDNGPGIPADLQERLFEPFATGRVGGTGLGLAIVQRAVEAHRGLVLVDTKAGGGTTFTVYFPAARRKEEAA